MKTYEVISKLREADKKAKLEFVVGSRVYTKFIVGTNKCVDIFVYQESAKSVTSKYVGELYDRLNLMSDHLNANIYLREQSKDSNKLEPKLVIKSVSIQPRKVIINASIK